MTLEILFAGFGGQGILFSGKLLAYKALLEDRQVSWLPSYGPEMSGGTANCSVTISDTPIGSPIITKPDILIAMNLPSLDKYEDAVKPGGKIFIDSTLITRHVKRTDVEVYEIPATMLANEMGAPTLANMVMTGKLMSVVPEISRDFLEDALHKCVSARHQNLYDLNLKAMDIGAAYEC